MQADADFVANVKLALSLLWHVENVRHSRLAVKPVACSCSSLHATDELEQLRTRLRKMTDAQLVSFGKAARSLCRDPKCPEVFKRQLEEAKTEWRRRHPKAQ